ncbi:MULTISPECIES: peptidoglycan-binding domain-containing protein [unclassified Mesorhizobium]|uniref:peptidoglycan-binding domain-containing protein n=1 Tax=unclassified Mesorhizobium TaxID=325217 RepID=UPI003015053D
MTWRLAKSLETLRAQINALSPNRSKISDGTIGDAAHASRSSDHNPWVKDGKTGIVTGMDLTHDPAHGIDSEALADALLASRDSRIKYVISNKKIASGSDGPSPWKWRLYTGKNPHNHHVHLSVKPDKASYDSTKPWAIDLKVSPAAVAAPATKPKNPVLVKGSKGADVKRLQGLLGLATDGAFGPKTEAAVVAFQKTYNLVSDGKVGPQTWDELAYQAAVAAQRQAQAAASPMTFTANNSTPAKPTGGWLAFLGAILLMFRSKK